MDKILSYDRDVFGRQFMQCGQRHGVVFLKRRGLPVENLLYSAFHSSDLLLDQIVINKKPKYRFQSDFYSESDLDVLGVKMQKISAENYAELDRAVDEAIEQDGFVLLGGDVFYFPHCPEYKNTHLSHQIVVRGVRSDGWVEIVDDNPASILCEYVYSRQEVVDFFDNNIKRRMIRLIQVRDVSEKESLGEMRCRFDGYIGRHSDSFRLYESIGDYLENSFEAFESKIRCLRDVFTLLSGSRLCFRRYLEYIGAPKDIIVRVQDLSDKSFALKSVFIRAEITRKLNVDGILDSINRYKNLEVCVLDLLRKFSVRQSI